MFIVTPCHTLTQTNTHTHTVGSTSLDQGSARCKDLYLTTSNTLKRQTSMTPEEFEPATPASDRPQTHALDRWASRISGINIKTIK